MKKDIFSIGAQYRTKKDFKNAAFNYNEGEVLIFDRGAYSPYDIAAQCRFEWKLTSATMSVTAVNA